jgi:hypothetical protein
MMRKLLLATTLMLSVISSSFAQRYLGVATSNWSGTNALYLNPALMAGSRVKWSIKATIKKVSYKLLDEIVKILNDYPDYMMTIDGYTDNVGKPAKNLVLSKDRAASVKKYFVSKGIDETRIVTDGHGDADPKASNKTAKGRAKNRRVEMDLKLK